jgi:hypothetical protein
MKNKIAFETEAHECMCISDMPMQQDAEIKYYFQFLSFESRLKIVFGNDSNDSELRSRIHFLTNL